MTWVKKRILVTVKAAPEPSKKYGDCICTAGITEEGDWIRLYPIPLRLFQVGKGFKKFDWIEVECQRVSHEEKLGRKESHKIREDSLRIVDRSLSMPKKIDWSQRSKFLNPLKSTSIEDLQDAFQTDRTSLGLIRVGDLIDFYKTEDLTEEEKMSHHILQMTFEKTNGDEASLHTGWTLRQIPHIFKYRFKCDSPQCRSHDMTCEDWELFEAYRTWPNIYKTEEETWNKIRDHFYRFFKEERDLHFFMGTYSLFPTWMIIGIYYPPRPDA